MAAEGVWPYRRSLAAHEHASRVDVPDLDYAMHLSQERMVAAWHPLRQQHVDTLLAVVSAGVTAHPPGDAAWIARIELPALDASRLVAAVEAAIDEGRLTALDEAERQNPALAQRARTATLPHPEERIRAYAASAERVLAASLVQSATRETFRLTATSSEVDTERAVAGVLGASATRYEQDILQGMATGGVNEGRYHVMEAIVGAGPTGQLQAAEPLHAFYALEILDGNTCDPCAAIDGQEYATLEQARIDYPGIGGGYVNCDGRERCRGSLVIVYEEAGPSQPPPPLPRAPAPPPPRPPDTSEARAIAELRERGMLTTPPLRQLPGETAEEAASRMLREGVPFSEAQAWFKANADKPLLPAPSGSRGTSVAVKTSTGELTEGLLREMAQSEALTRLGLRVEIRGSGDAVSGRYNVGGIIKDAAGEIKGSFQRQISTSDHTVYHATFDINEELRGHGIAKDLLASHVRVYDQLGINEVTVTAAGKNGRYTWAKFGFDFPYAREIDPDFPTLPPGDLERLRNSFRSQLLAKGFDKIPPAITDPEAGLRAAFPESMKLIDEAVHSWNFAEMEIDEAGLTLTGKELMLKAPGWSGKLDLTPGSETRRIFDAYTAGH